MTFLQCEAAPKYSCHTLLQDCCYHVQMQYLQCRSATPRQALTQTSCKRCCVVVSFTLVLCARRVQASSGVFKKSSLAELAQLIVCVHPQEYARLPLRLSRQLQLGAINEGLAFITRGVQAQLARGFPLDAAGALLLLSSFYC